MTWFRYPGWTTGHDPWTPDELQELRWKVARDEDEIARLRAIKVRDWELVMRLRTRIDALEKMLDGTQALLQLEKERP